MPSPKRECASCQFFQNAQLAGNGWCTHPKRQLASDVRILVRSRELACRNSWGEDLWVAASSPATTHVERAINRSDPVEPAFQQDDTVTSVVDTGSHPGVRAFRPTGDEDRITHTAVRGDELPPAQRAIDDINVLANDDQTDRVRIMARGSKDAILRARERAAQRKQPVRPMIEPATSEVTGDTPVKAGQGEPAPTEDSTVNRMAAYERTPPVPREEVPSAGRETSPAVPVIVALSNVRVYEALTRNGGFGPECLAGMVRCTDKVSGSAPLALAMCRMIDQAPRVVPLCHTLPVALTTGE